MNIDHASATERCAGEVVLIEAAKIDPAAFEPLYQHYMARIYRYLYMRVRHAEDAADLTQQVFLKALHALPGYRVRGVVGRSAGIRMQLAVVENGIAPSPAVLEKAITILSARFSQFGLEGSKVSLKQANGQATILVTLPSFGSNEQQAVDKLLEPGKIGFWDTGSEVLARGTSFNPKDYARYNPSDQPRFTNRDINLDSLSVSQNVTLNIYAINFTMQNEAINRYAHFTGSHLGDTVTVVLDGKVMMSAMIEDEIPDGAAGITDNFTLQQANAIVAALKSGVLPVELRKLN
ncbi:MAG TPA: sigma factor [Ktedonobacteraceae bacterium]